MSEIAFQDANKKLVLEDASRGCRSAVSGAWLPTPVGHSRRPCARRRRCHGHSGSRAEQGSLTVDPLSVITPVVRPSHTWHRTTSQTPRRPNELCRAKRCKSLHPADLPTLIGIDGRQPTSSTSGRTTSSTASAHWSHSGVHDGDRRLALIRPRDAVSPA